MKKSEHTPTPWHKTALDKIVNSTGTTVIANLNLLEFGTDGNTAIANAAFIVRAVNNHDALVEALEMALREMHELRAGKPLASGKAFFHVDQVLAAAKGNER